jgi:hypothetical protein
MPSDENMIDMILASRGSLGGLIASGYPAIHVYRDTFTPRLAGHTLGGRLEYGYDKLISAGNGYSQLHLDTKLALMTLNFISQIKELPALERKSERCPGHPDQMQKKISRMLEADPNSMSEQ